MTIRAPQILRRSSAVTLCALASLFLAACGGGGSGADGSRLDSAAPFSERPASGAQSGDQSTSEPRESEQASSPETDTNESEQTVSDNEGATTDPSPEGTTNDELTDSGSTDDGSTSGEDVLDPVEEVSGEVIASEVDGAVTLEWYRPQYRENGEIIRDGEIGGYEVRYRQVGAQEAESVVLDGEWEVEYKLEGLEAGEYEFAVAAYDTNGLYSEFVSISPLQ